MLVLKSALTAGWSTCMPWLRSASTPTATVRSGHASRRHPRRRCHLHRGRAPAGRASSADSPSDTCPGCGGDLRRPRIEAAQGSRASRCSSSGPVGVHAFRKTDRAPNLVRQSAGTAEQEIRRRTDVVEIFPDRTALIRSVGEVLDEQPDEGIEGRRYLGFDVLTRSRSNDQSPEVVTGPPGAAHTSSRDSTRSRRVSIGTAGARPSAPQASVLDAPVDLVFVCDESLHRFGGTVVLAGT